MIETSSPLKSNNTITIVATAIAAVTIVALVFTKSSRKGTTAKRKEEENYDAAATTSKLITKDGKFNTSDDRKKGDEESWESHVKDHGSLREIWQGKLYILEAEGCDRGPPVRNMIIYRVPEQQQQQQQQTTKRQKQQTDVANRDEENNHPQQQGRRQLLLIYNAIAVREKTLSEIVSLGTPTIMIVPNYLHRCCAGVWKRRFPHLQVVCPEIAKKQVSEIVPVDMSIDELAELDKTWSRWVHSKVIDGWGNFENVIEVELEDDDIQQQSLSSTTSSIHGTKKKAMIVCDLLFTVPFKKNASYAERFLIWLFDSSIDIPAGGKIIVPKIARLSRLFAIKDWSKAEKWYRTYASENGKHIVSILVGHGPPVVEVNPSEGCTKAFEGIADQLTKPRW